MHATYDVYAQFQHMRHLVCTYLFIRLVLPSRFALSTNHNAHYTHVVAHIELMSKHRIDSEQAQNKKQP